MFALVSETCWTRLGTGELFLRSVPAKEATINAIGFGDLEPQVAPISELCTVLASGGDERIVPDPVTRRNRYGIGAFAADGEISFASTTANPWRSDALAAAQVALDHWRAQQRSISANAPDWFDEVRERLGKVFAVRGTESVLTASGTDCEVIMLGLVLATTERPVTNIFLAPDETGKGVPLAASGRHFQSTTALARPVRLGGAIGGFNPGRVESRAINIRDRAGNPRPGCEVNVDTARAVQQELARGRDVLIHVLDSSKAGLAGLWRCTARHLLEAGQGRVRIVVDACQLRCPLSQVREDLADGFAVIVTGSKFAGGPPFCGALLLPESLSDAVKRSQGLPDGLADYSAIFDWPRRLRPMVAAGLSSTFNIGPALRWVAALQGLEAYMSIDESIVADILARFRAQAVARAARLSGVEVVTLPDKASAFSGSILALSVLDEAGRYTDEVAARKLQAALRDPRFGPVCHVGQPVAIGKASALRVSASARDVVRIAGALSTGSSIDEAFRPLCAGLNTLFGKWADVARHRRHTAA